MGPVPLDAPAPPAAPPAAAPQPGRPWIWRLAGAVLLAISAWTVADRWILHFPDEIWLVDLEVYREGARSVVEGRPVYAWLTGAPQYLPFTYPPFGALLGLPLLLAPFGVVGWAWTVLQVVLLWVTAGIAFRPLVERGRARAGLVQGAVAAVLVQLQPLQEGLRFGQVNSILVTLVLVDVARRRTGWWPRGSLTGLAAAVKLTPAVFWLHWAVTRQWRAAAASVGTAAAVTGLTALFAPSASAAYWTGALLDPSRLGPNAGTANQSLRGMLLRIGPPEGPWLSLTWVLCVAGVAVLGLRLSARLDRLGEPVAVVGAVGLIAVLVSPVSWTHHLHWGIPALGALLGDGRSRARVGTALAGGAVLFSRLPWTGNRLGEANDGWLAVVGGVLEQSYCWFALLALLALWWFLVRGRAVPERSAQIGVGTPAAASSVSTARTAQTPPPTRRTVARLSRRSSARPSSAPTPETTSSAAHAPAKTDTGSW
jgi:alpha-1,2-mannosyltransferase